MYNDILETIGNTPVVKINKISPPDVTIYVKLESFNPAGSVKDRLAMAMIIEAERQGILKPGQTVVEATSGNTGIALAMVCAVKGYPFVAVMADSFSVERRKLMRAYGAKVILTPAAARGTCMVQRAEELAKKHGWFLTRQFDNEAGPFIHRNTTGAEILSLFATKRLDYWVTGYGTGGTLTGAGQMIKRARPETKIICAEPEEAAQLAGEKWNPHKIQGWTPDFIPSVLDRSIPDKNLKIPLGAALKAAKDLAALEGIFVGISSGATFAAGLQIAAEAPKGSVILVMLPDTGERYLSTVLFQDVNADDDAEWLATLEK